MKTAHCLVILALCACGQEFTPIDSRSAQEIVSAARIDLTPDTSTGTVRLPPPQSLLLVKFASSEPAARVDVSLSEVQEKNYPADGTPWHNSTLALNVADGNGFEPLTASDHALEAAAVHPLRFVATFTPTYTDAQGVTVVGSAVVRRYCVGD